MSNNGYTLSFLVWLSVSACSMAPEQLLPPPGRSQPDGKIGPFRQNDTGNCFFLAALLALGFDPEGKRALESALPINGEPDRWRIVFPNVPERPVTVTAEELTGYRLKNSDGAGFSPPVSGDPDIALLEIAADKLWRDTIKAEGLWDDVPMNVLFMFSKAKQILLWNRQKAPPAALEDIGKIRRIPAGIAIERPVANADAARAELKSIVDADRDGLSMVLIDYETYHAVAIDRIDFSRATYSYVDTESIRSTDNDLDQLLRRLADGVYALAYVEVN